ncbi:hypothetical protein OXPF_26200 [Oxobacter pfennigii]|uniref:Uncharacterized protein n=1 Tax=Oxobacter pfennigii TaxID=36849 RepID=A0A0N8NT39_9CLOT|nr:hypothetical protein OXPF_26200 [Oxobacter pfennigii]
MDFKTKGNFTHILHHGEVINLLFILFFGIKPNPPHIRTKIPGLKRRKYSLPLRPGYSSKPSATGWHSVKHFSPYSFASLAFTNYAFIEFYIKYLKILYTHKKGNAISNIQYFDIFFILIQISIKF